VTERALGAPERGALRGALGRWNAPSHQSCCIFLKIRGLHDLATNAEPAVAAELLHLFIA
jgi:hypothetical protein